jgi:multiple sugar transport system ATP-binding protein
VVYGIRPEHLLLDASGVAATVHVTEPTGSETQVIMHLAGTQVVGAFRERIAEKPGQNLHIAPDPALVHLFDEQTGMRLN